VVRPEHDPAAGAVVKARERKARRCAACGQPVGTTTIVAGGEFPDAPLCATCGGPDRTCEEVNEMIRARLAGIDGAVS